LQFRILGSLEVLGSAGSIAVGGAKRRGVLAYFLVHRGSLLSAERIAGEIWEQNDDRGIATVQTYVSQLRKLMASETDVALRTRPAGYVLELPDDALDASRFETLSRAANGELSARQRVAQLEAALALWRGAALEEFTWP
jgi:DNA-binding SARP family transcriptional activator